jgi:hypothetical protein
LFQVCPASLRLTRCLHRLPDAVYDTKRQEAVAAAVRRQPGALVRLYGVDLCHADPDMPLELQHADNAMVLDYYRDLAAGSVVVRRCRLMLLGSGAAGKSSLAACLVRGGGVGAGGPSATTHGVEQRTCHARSGWGVYCPPPPTHTYIHTPSLL